MTSGSVRADILVLYVIKESRVRGIVCILGYSKLYHLKSMSDFDSDFVNPFDKSRAC